MKVFIGVLIGIVFMIVVDAVNVHNERMKEQAPLILGAGNEGCLYYLRDRENGHDTLPYFEWVSGYISALNFEFKKRKHINPSIVRLDEFCKKKPLIELSEALHSMYEEEETNYPDSFLLWD